MINYLLLENKGKTEQRANDEPTINRGTTWIHGTLLQLPVRDLQSGALYRTGWAKVKRQKEKAVGQAGAYCLFLLPSRRETPVNYEGLVDQQLVGHRFNAGMPIVQFITIDEHFD